jgi:Ca2+-binding EF-hand superfamily protein
MREALRSKFTDEELHNIFENVDFDHSGTISYHQFLSATISRQQLTEENMRTAFEAISHHQNSFTSEDLASIVGVDVTISEVS